ncbi:hypothetical protein ACFYE9_33265 [Rhizobium leguminosarum]|uniref:Uncharacterized protein n=1 Tax=Rhizobium leguminosarum TaxID=384 RepID=A0A154I7I9_RHILE|nr:hypothetical protein [Rhizobium leguminosarum]KZA96395.1 hypothetical protein A4A59_34985 [Rhizobium leguminosarum]
MDSSYGKNAPNRIEESYGDAKNLHLRHPLAALGFLFGLRSDILKKEPKTTEWLFDLLAKLGQEEAAEHLLANIAFMGDALICEAANFISAIRKAEWRPRRTAEIFEHVPQAIPLPAVAVL